MGYRRKIFSFALVVATAIGAVTGVARTAHADIYSNIFNTRGYFHLMNTEWVDGEPRCLYADAETHNAEVWRCLNALSEEWRQIPVSATGPGGETDHFLLQSNWTGLCMAIPNSPINGTPVIQAPCNADDVRQYWKSYYHGPSSGSYSDYLIVSFQGSLCLDRPDGNGTLGLQLQMWTCRPRVPAGGDQHWEQSWQFLPASW